MDIFIYILKLLCCLFIESRTTLVTRNSGIAFFARIKDDVSNLVNGQYLKFEDIITQEGNDYNNSTGMFTCSIPGLYIFTVSLLTFPDKCFEGVIVSNSNSLAYLYSCNDNHFGHSSNTVAVRLSAGDTVSVYNFGDQHRTGSILRSGYSTFTGFLLHA